MSISAIAPSWLLPGTAAAVPTGRNPFTLSLNLSGGTTDATAGAAANATVAGHPHHRHHHHGIQTDGGGDNAKSLGSMLAALAGDSSAADSAGGTRVSAAAQTGTANTVPGGTQSGSAIGMTAPLTANLAQVMRAYAAAHHIPGRGNVTL